MSYVAIVFLALTIPPSEVSEAAVEKSPDVAVSQVATPPTAVELRESVRAALRKWARPTDKQADAAAKELLKLYEQLDRDDQLARSQREYYRAKVRGRLMRLSGQIAHRTIHEKRREETARRQASTNRSSGSMADLLETPEKVAVDSGASRGGGGVRNDDNGEDLVELIQQTIAPTTWDTVGGTGSIFYWYPGRAIVVRQQGEVHDQIGGLLEQMGRLSH